MSYLLVCALVAALIVVRSMIQRELADELAELARVRRVLEETEADDGPAV